MSERWLARPAKQGTRTRGRSGLFAFAAGVLSVALGIGTGAAGAQVPLIASKATAARPPLRRRRYPTQTPTVPPLWPTFSTPKSLVVANVEDLSDAEVLTATTLEGVYNGEQHSNRLYLIETSPDQWWLQHGGIPKGIRTTLFDGGTASAGLLTPLLEGYKSYIKGAIVTNATNDNTINLATTMAGIDHAVVIEPSEESLMQTLGIPIIYSFNTTTFTNDSALQTYEWAVQNLLPDTNSKDLVMLNPEDYADLRDYIVASRSFVFYLTSTVSTAETDLMNQILATRAPGTPVLGYIPNETSDVADLSSVGHFLNASDLLSDESVWASMPSPAALRQPFKPAPVSAEPNTVYVAFPVSDGDNAQYVENKMSQVWQDPDLGAVPEGWTVAPGMIDYAPSLLEYFYRHLPKDSELIAGPSGIGYATDTDSSEMQQFAQLSAGIMARDDIHTVDNWEAPSLLDQYAEDSGIRSISSEYSIPYQSIGNSVIFGQTSSYITTPESLYCEVAEQTSSYSVAGQPLFLEPLADGWTITPQDVLNVAQQLTLLGERTGQKFVFLTPTELSETMQRYYDNEETGLPSSNVQAETGAATLLQTLQTPSYSFTAGETSGTNLVTNPSGASGTSGWVMAYGGDDATLSSTTVNGSAALNWTVSSNFDKTDWLSYYPDVTNGDTYTFSAKVSGSGEIYLNVWTGTANVPTKIVRLTSTPQTVTWTVAIPSNAPTGQTGQAPQLQLDAPGSLNVNIQDATVQASTQSCS